MSPRKEPVVSRAQLRQLARACVQVAKEVADETGFVRLQALANFFSIPIVCRPLLVQGMLATAREPDSIQSQVQVLLDSERFRVGPKEIQNETSESPLSARLRNTCAHEFVHLLAFRSTEFGVKLRSSNGPSQAFHDAIEKVAEQLSPMLLIPENALEVAFGDNSGVSVEDVGRLVDHLGVSTYVFLNRMENLRLCGQEDILRLKPLCNVALGHIDAKSRSLRDWPLFINYDNGLVPSFLLELRSEKAIDPVATFPSGFRLAGGNAGEAHMKTFAGTEKLPQAVEMDVTISMELPGTHKTRSALFMTRKRI